MKAKTLVFNFLVYIASVFELGWLYFFRKKSFLIKELSQAIYWSGRNEKDFSERDVEQYDQYYSIFFGEIVLLLSEKEVVTLLDVGCNYGRRTNMLASAFPSREFTGIDLSSECIEFGKKKLRLVDNLTLEVGDALNLQFPDSSFDVVYTVVSMSHMHHSIVERAFLEMARVCKKTLILIEVDFFAWSFKKQLSTVRMDYMFFHRYLSIAPKSLTCRKVVRLCLGESEPRYSAFVFSKL